NPAIARRIYSLLKQNYQVESELLVRRKMKLKKNNQYIVRLKYDTNTVLKDLDIVEEDGFTIHTKVSEDVINEDQRVRS
ncbi:DNA-binding protein WhiA, partial [Staphylococcus epidermidis]